jgi:hypothetical protein
LVAMLTTNGTIARVEFTGKDAESLLTEAARSPLAPWMIRVLEKYVVVLIEGDSDFAGEHADPDVVALAFAIQLDVDPFGWTSAGLKARVDGWREMGMTPSAIPRIEAPLVAKVIAAGLDEELLVLWPAPWDSDADIEPDECDDLTALAELARAAGPEHGDRLLGHIEAHLDRLDAVDAEMAATEAPDVG